METVNPPDVDRMVRLDTEFRAASGLTDRRFYKIFYSAIAPAPLLVIGFNPGGETDGTDLNASESFYENWEHDYVDFRSYGNAYKLAGRAYDTLQGSLRELGILRESGIPKARGYRTPQKYRPSAGAVGAPRRRSRPSRTSVAQEGSASPFPTVMSKPTMLRTI